MTTTTHNAPHPEEGPVAAMRPISHRLIAAGAIQAMCQHLARLGIEPEAIITALVSIGAEELTARHGVRTAAASFRTFAEGLDTIPAVTLHDAEVRGHA